MILKNTNNGSNSVPYEKVHKSVNHDTAEKDKVKKDMKTQLKTMLFHQLLLIGYKFQKNVTMGHLNSDSLNNKMEAVEELIKNNIDVCFL